MDPQRADPKSVKLDRVKLVEAVVAYRRWFVDARGKPNPSFTKAHSNFDILYEQISAIVAKTEAKNMSYGETVENFLVLLSSNLFTYANKFFFTEGGGHNFFASTEHTAIAKQIWWVIKEIHIYLIDGALHPVLGAGEESIQVGSTTITSTITVSDHRAVRIPNGAKSKYYEEIQAINVFIDMFARNANALHLSKTDMMQLCRTAFSICIDTPALSLELPSSISSMLIDLSCGEIDAIELLNAIFDRFKEYDIEISRVFTMLLLFVKNQINLCFFDEEYDMRVCTSSESSESSYKRGLLKMLKRIHPLVINLRSAYPPKYIDSELIDVILRTFLVHLISISITDSTLYIYLNTLAHSIRYCRNSYSSAANQILVYLIVGCEKSKLTSPVSKRPSLAEVTSRMDQLTSSLKKNAPRTSVSSATQSIDVSLKPPEFLKIESSLAMQEKPTLSSKNVAASTPIEWHTKSNSHFTRSPLTMNDSPSAVLEDSLKVMEMPSPLLCNNQEKVAPITTQPSAVLSKQMSPPRVVPKPPSKKYNVSITNDSYNYTPIWKYSGFILHQMDALTNRDQPLDNFIYAISKVDGSLVPILNFVAETEHYHYQMYLPNLLKYIISLDHTYFSCPGHLSNAYKLVSACMHILQSLLDIGFAMTITELEQSVKTMISPVNNVSCNVLQGYSSPLPMLRRNNRCYMKTISDVKELTANTPADTAKMDIYVEIGRKSISNTIKRSHLSVTFPPDMSTHVAGLFSSDRTLKSASSTTLSGLCTGYNSPKISSPIPQQARERNPMLFAQEQTHSFILDGTGTFKTDDLPSSVINSKEYHFQFVYMHSPLLYFALEAYSHLVRISNYILSFSTDSLEETLISRDARNKKTSEILFWIPLQYIEDVDPWPKYGAKLPLSLSLFRLRSFVINFRTKQVNIEQTLDKKKKTKKRKMDLLSRALPGNRFTQSAIERSLNNSAIEQMQHSNISIDDMISGLGDEDLLEKIPFFGGKASSQPDVLGSLLSMIRIGTGVLENLVLLDSTYADFRYNMTMGDLALENWPFPIGKISCHFSLHTDGQTLEVDHPVYINASHTWDYLYGLTRTIVLRMDRDIVFKRTLNFGNFVLLSQTKGDEAALQEALEQITERHSRILCYLLGRKVQ
ncbi:hypothetical protein GL50803_0010291 [Giardia duodenalis]|uniref:Uncharacterized protein n=1 Tax=Giardia intestinalis (strain ATCC 50803 / WB clone C6) TaxID=184922 RepID=A8B4B2_GIAIC|nr:hypothetical protein GL50803_0010291 [Giardia intestinalis]KAE8303646.1 hypothetical protein GL50803_0010291 [Giardia intestinalis]|eukprot:XP_001709543.1 Hypothetical protein GL50803_10291 [Giardia lamblia ATCC 50803]